MSEHTPAVDHPHVLEGVCTCDTVMPGMSRKVRYSTRCGLSTHRVWAAAKIETERNAK